MEPGAEVWATKGERMEGWKEEMTERDAAVAAPDGAGGNGVEGSSSSSSVAEGSAGGSGKSVFGMDPLLNASSHRTNILLFPLFFVRSLHL